MVYEAFKDKTGLNEWRVEAFDMESGDCFVVIFSGSQSQERAESYASWMNSK